MSINELTYFVISCFAAYVLAFVVAQKYGPVGFVVGFIFGFVLSLIALVCLFFAKRAYYQRFPVFPMCKRGKCNAYDYRLVEKSQQRKVYMCKCGDYYVLVNGRFCVLSSDGTVHPYMMRYGFPPRWKLERVVKTDNSLENSTHSGTKN